MKRKTLRFKTILLVFSALLLALPGLPRNAQAVTPASSVSLTAAKASPQTVGTAITFTGQAEGGSGNYEYQFRTNFGTTSKIVRSYSTANTWTWDTTSAAAGLYTIKVLARNAGSTASYEVLKSIAYTLSPPPAADATLSVDPASPQNKGTQITFTGQGSGGTGTYEYQFRTKFGTTWTTVQPYATTSTWNWDTSAAQAGIYTVELRVRTAGRAVAYDVIKTMRYTVNPPPVADATLAVDPGSTTSVTTFRAQGFGGSGNYEYQFRTKLGTTWTTVQPYSTTSTWSWDTTAAAAGSYLINVRVRNAGSASAYDVQESISFTPPVGNVTLASNTASPQTPGTQITFTAQANGGSGTYEYQFWKKLGTDWTLAQNWSILNSWAWDTEAETAGVYSIKVHARNAGSTASFEGLATSDQTLTQPDPESFITALTPNELKAGTHITVAGSGFGNDKGASSLTVGGVQTDDILSWSDSEIQAVVHPDAMTGPVKAKVNDKESDKKEVVVLWDNENPQNVNITPTDFSPLQSQILQDGTGGAIIVWKAYGPTGKVNIFAQRLNSRGKTTWESEVVLSASRGAQGSPRLASDNHGGAIVVWEEYRGDGSAAYGDIYAQRISASGALLWGSGAKVCTAANAQEKPKIAPDGEDGAIIVWYDQRNGYESQTKVYAQRISSNGVAQWQENGVEISQCTAFRYPEIVSDESGGAIIVWQDSRTGASLPYAQKIDGSGAIKWTTGGAPLSAVAANSIARPVSDGAGGAIIGWQSSGGDIYAQRIDENGAIQWGTERTLVTAALGTQSDLDMTTDGNGGAILTWQDPRNNNAGNQNIYAQSLDASGVRQWTSDVPVCTAQYAQFAPKIVSDNRGGAIITWYDYRNYDHRYYDYSNYGQMQGVDVFAQRLNSEGAPLWTPDGEAISTAPLHQWDPTIAADKSGGAIILWEDARGGVTLYAQGISKSGKQ